jgi:2',3'-cyclic-nucleotide 2'-phosphodiesterase / 3'-nucleotidase
MRRRGTWAVGAVALALTVGTAAPASAAPKGGDTLDLTMLATTDLHGRAQNWDYFADRTYAERSGDTTGLAKVASVVDSVRQTRGEDSVFVVDNGDFLQGTPLTYYYAKQEPVTETGVEHPMAAAYDAIGYDAQVVGNHEFNYGLDLLDAYTDDVDHPVLGANVIDEAPGRRTSSPTRCTGWGCPGTSR